ncbi:MAG TPA: extracellular solute-binding protein [bacterium]|nr:extracellular solute-binding protein [bacterium]
MRKRAMHTVAFLLVALMAIPLLGSVPLQAQQPLTLRVLDEGPQVGPWHKAAMDYERVSNGRVRVEWIASPWPGIHTRLATSFAAGDTPIDITKTWGGWTNEFWPFFHAIDERWPQQQRDGLLPYALHPVSAAGHFYGVPRHVTLYYFYWNKKMFQEAGLDPNRPPQTLDELVTACKKLTRDRDGDGRIDQWGYAESMEAGSPMLNTFERWLYRAGGDVLDARGNPVFNDRRGVRALQVVYDLIHTHKCMDAGQMQLGNGATRQVFNAGRVAMMSMWGSGWAESHDSNRTTKDVIGNVGITILPALDASVARSATIHGSEGYAITKSAARRGVVDEAWRLLQHMTSTSIQLEALKTRGYLPPSLRLYQDPELTRDAYLGPLMAATAEAGRYPVKRFVWSDYGRIEDTVESELQNALRGRKPIPDALNTAAAAVTRILKGP